MRAFAALYAELDGTTKTNAKVAAMAGYFAAAAPAEAAWAVYFLTGRKIRQLVPSKKLRSWVMEIAGISEWLLDECYSSVGDSAECIALLLPEPGDTVSGSLDEWVETRLMPLPGMAESAQRRAVTQAWACMSARQAFVYNKLITGQLRVGVSQLLVVRALAQASGVAPNVVAHRLMGEWRPTPGFYRGLVAPVAEGEGERDAEAEASRPYPFCLAHPLESEPTTLGDVGDWQAEWKWDGIRAQLIRRHGRTFLWSRGEELVTDRYPELRDLGDRLPAGTVIDGEILPWRGGAVRPFAELQKRIGRKTVTKKLLAEIPVVLMAYDLLEWNGRDLRDEPLSARRALLEDLAAAVERDIPAEGGIPAGELFADDPAGSGLVLSPLVEGATWDELATVRAGSRGRAVEGLMLKRKTSVYRVGRVRGDWWKWKVEPFSVDAVLTTAQRGTGKRASLYTDYTFAVWDGDKLVPFAKAYSGLTDAEIDKVDAFVRAHTVEKFGPVRAVTPELVFELGFEGIQRSTRHKSGVAVRFPRILRQRHDKKPQDADTLETVRALANLGGDESP